MKANIGADQEPKASPSPRPKGFKVRASSKASPSRHSLTLRLGDDGTPQWSKLSEATQEAWREILHRPETARDLGFQPPQAGETVPPQEFVSPETVGALYAVIGGLEARIFAKVYKVPPEIASRIFCFQKQEIDLLTPPTQKVLGKYAPGLLSKYGDEIGLALLLISITQAKVAACSAIAAKLKEKAQAEETAKPNGADHSPVSEFEVEPQGVEQ
ncbi:MAG TPA: hypothetical protein VGY31_03415 [Terriglobia bacterium]|nr:hypothetical protein [Terriglobia bacterium]